MNNLQIKIILAIAQIKDAFLEEDVDLAGVIRALLLMWLRGEIPTPEPEPLRSEDRDDQLFR